MSFMISLFGSEQTGKPKFKRRISVGKGNTVGDAVDDLGSPTAGFSNGKTKEKSGKAQKQRATMDSSVTPKRVLTRQRSSVTALPPEDDEGNVEYKVRYRYTWHSLRLESHAFVLAETRRSISWPLPTSGHSNEMAVTRRARRSDLRDRCGRRWCLRWTD